MHMEVLEELNWYLKNRTFDINTGENIENY